MPSPKEPAFLGADLGGTSLRFALVTAGSTIVARRRVKTPPDRSAAAVLQAISVASASLLEEARSRGLATAALGLGVPGLVQAVEGRVVVSPNFPTWDREPLKQMLEARVGIPVCVENDVNAIAQGEARFGAGRGARDFMVVTLGTGVGGGLILGGRLRRGPDGTAGEIGHVTVRPGGRRCNCGNRGCLESYASGTAIAARAVQAGLCPSGESSAERVASLARGGSKAALSIFRDAGRCLGIVFAGVANLLNLEKVVIGGGVVGAWDLIAPAAEREIMRRAFSVPACRLRVCTTQLFDDAGVLGAAYLARKIVARAA